MSGRPGTYTHGLGRGPGLCSVVQCVRGRVVDGVCLIMECEGGQGSSKVVAAVARTDIERERDARLGWQAGRGLIESTFRGSTVNI